MNIDYSSILKTDRVQPENGASGSILTESENDRSKILFSPAFRRLQQHAQVFPLNASRAARSKLNHALQAAQAGRSIANLIAAHLESENLASRIECAALANITETACLARDIGNPPFGRAGEAAIQRWFTEYGPDKIRVACRTYGTRELSASDPRLVNALTDFYEFDNNPQGLRMLTKFQWNNDPAGSNLTKTSIASYLKYLRMAGGRTGDESERFGEKPGFFSTEAGLVKNVWSTFAYDAAAQRFPLSHVVDAAEHIVSSICDLEEAIDANFLQSQEAIDSIKEQWLSTYIPVDPELADEQILDILTAAAKGKNSTSDAFSFADLRRALITTLSGYAARRYIEQHQAVFDGTLDTLLPPESGAGCMLATLRSYCQRHVYCLEPVQRNELTGYSVIHGLLTHFGILLECPNERFQTALDFSSEQETSDKSLYFGQFIERKLLALIPVEYRNAYAHLVAQLGSVGGRDSEFEEWNARAHLLTDFVTGMTESAATAMFQALSGKHI